jgi:hypothetical protein
MSSTTGIELESRNFSESHIDEDLSELTGFHEGALFYNCKFRNLRGLTLKDCVLSQSSFTTDKLEEAMGFTFTVGNCNTFRDVEYSEYLFDLLLIMMIQTAGNTEKRKKLIDVVGRKKVYETLRQFKTLDVPKE